MIRPLAITTIAAAIVMAATSTAVAAPGDYYATGFETVNNGTGSADADAEADAFGRLSADSSATGGTKRGLLGSSSKTSSGTARAYVSDGGDVTEGRYEVVVTYTGAYTDESESGNGVSQGRVLSNAGFFGPNGFGESVPVGVEDAELPSAPGTVTLRYEVHIPGPGQLSISAEVQALSSAKGKGNAASTGSDAEATFITFTKIG